MPHLLEILEGEIKKDPLGGNGKSLPPEFEGGGQQPENRHHKEKDDQNNGDIEEYLFQPAFFHTVVSFSNLLTFQGHNV